MNSCNKANTFAAVALATALGWVAGTPAVAIEYPTYQPSVFNSANSTIPFADIDGTVDGYLFGTLPAGSNATRTGTGTFASLGNFTVTGTVSDGAFAGDQGASGGGFWGTDLVGGNVFAVARPTAVTVNQTQVEPPFQPFVPPGGVEVIAFKGDTDTIVAFTLDFSTLAGGLLPAGSFIAYTDVDGNETASLAAFDGSLALLSGWLTLGTAGDFSLGNSPGQPDPGPADLPTVTFGPVSVDIAANATNTDSPGLIFQTLVPIRQLTISATDLDATPFYQSFAVAIPEPGAALLLVAASGVLLLRRRR